jgi:hypothetical protein
MPKIIFLPFETTVQTDGSKTILQLAQDARIPLQSTCGGKKNAASAALSFRNPNGIRRPAMDPFVLRKLSQVLRSSRKAGISRTRRHYPFSGAVRFRHVLYIRP